MAKRSLEILRRNLWFPATGFCALLLGGMVCAIYAPYLTNPFVFDDLNAMPC